MTRKGWTTCSSLLPPSPRSVRLAQQIPSTNLSSHKSHFCNSCLLTGDEGKDDEGGAQGEDDYSDEAQKVKRRRLVQPLEAAYAHFEQQDAHLQQAAAFGKMLVRPH